MNDLSPHQPQTRQPLRPPRRRPSEQAINNAIMDHHPSSSYRSQGFNSPTYPPSSYSPVFSESPSRQQSARIGIEPQSPSSNGGPSTNTTATIAALVGVGGVGGAMTSTSFSRTESYEDPRKRRLDTLATMDNAEFGWFHVRACMVAGVGFFTDAYDLFAISLVSPMLGYVYYQHNNNTVPADIDLGIKISASLGTFFGQIGFGYLADKLGRKRMYGVELLIIIVATFGQSLSGDSFGLSLPAGMILWRFILGVGVGGDYPLSAVITSEFATTHRRGAMMAAVFAMQGFGYLTTGMVAIVLLIGFRSMIEQDPRNLDYVWRCLIGLGCVPALVAVYFRMTIPETPRYVLDVENNLIKAERDVATVLNTRNALQSDRDVFEDRQVQFNLVSPTGSSSRNNALGTSGGGSGGGGVGGGVGGGTSGQHDTLDMIGSTPFALDATSHKLQSGISHAATIRDVIRYFSRWETFRVLMGTSMTWFALDVAFYGIGLNNSFILSTIHFGNVDGDAYHTIWNASVGQVIIVLLGAIPGYWVTVLTIERLGRIKIQVIGFVMSCLLFCTLGFAYNSIRNYSPVLFVFLFALTQFFQNFGPNATTFIIPGEVFPTRFRSTGHGISAGMGKLGAIVAQIGFSSMKDRGGVNQFIPQLLQIFALFMFIGLLFTWFVPETMGKTLEELCGEDDYAERKLEKERPFHNALFDEKDDEI